MYDWSFSVVWDYRMVYVHGALITLQLSLLAVVFSLSLGLVVGIARQSQRRSLSFPAAWYVEIFRDTPLLIQIVWIFYCLPILMGVTLSAFWASVVALLRGWRETRGKVNRLTVNGANKSIVH